MDNSTILMNLRKEIEDIKDGSLASWEIEEIYAYNKVLDIIDRMIREMKTE